MGKTRFDIQYNCSDEQVVNLINQWLRANGFKLENTDGYQWFHSKTNGYHKGFEYQLNNGNLTVFAFTNVLKRACDLNATINVMYGTMYKNKINELFAQIYNINNNDNNMNNQYNNMSNQYGNNTVINPFEKRNSETNGVLAVVALICSIFTFICSLVGVMIGIVLWVVQIALGINGLKSNKKGLAIASLVISIVTVIIYFIQIICAIF